MNSPSQTPKKKGAQCSHCSRSLSSSESIEQGIGPICAEHRAAQLVGAGTSVEELGTLAEVPGASKWIHLFNQALVAKHPKARRDAAIFLAQARALAGQKQVLPPTGELRAA